MKRGLVLASLSLIVGGTALGQAKKEEKVAEKTTVRTETKTVAPSGWDLTTELWSFADARPIACGQFDVRLTARWIPEPTQRNEDDDFIFQPSIVWGIAENIEVWANVPIWVGDSGDRGAYEDGNYDTNFGVLWRFLEPQGAWVPAMALGGALRVPTGDGSDGVDAEVRLALTNEYDSGLRSHINGWLKTVNGTNNETSAAFRTGFWDDTFDDRLVGDRTGYTRDFQWGFSAGLDGPITDTWRWVANYVHRSSETYGETDINELEGGLEWQVADAHKVGISAKMNADHGNEDIPDYSASLTYAITLAK